ncbi:MAG: NUDIX hydrolase [Micrococcus sp.]|nr:NUDIX hydrolase [Micrococcus sp.]
MTRPSSPDRTQRSAANATPETVPARGAASLLLIRDADARLEVFALRRAGSMAFSAHATAFPGGRVDSGDALPPELWRETDLHDWAERLGLAHTPQGAASTLAAQDPAEAAGMVLAATVRETYEETGVLLARDAATGDPVDPQRVAAWGDAPREDLEAHRLDFGTFLAREDLLPDTGALAPWSRWITPVGGPRRYDTVFFVVALPEGQSPERLSSEAASHGWASPDALLEQFRAGTVNLMTPSWWQLRRLQDAGDAGWAGIRDRAAEQPVRAVMLDPRAEDHEREQEFCYAREYLADLRSFRANARVEESPDNVL